MSLLECHRWALRWCLILLNTNSCSWEHHAVVGIIKDDEKDQISGMKIDLWRRNFFFDDLLLYFVFDCEFDLKRSRNRRSFDFVDLINYKNWNHEILMECQWMSSTSAAIGDFRFSFTFVFSLFFLPPCHIEQTRNFNFTRVEMKWDFVIFFWYFKILSAT